MLMRTEVKEVFRTSAFSALSVTNLLLLSVGQYFLSLSAVVYVPEEPFLVVLSRLRSTQLSQILIFLYSKTWICGSSVAAEEQTELPLKQENWAVQKWWGEALSPISARALPSPLGLEGCAQIEWRPVG